MTDRWRRVGELFAQVVAAPPGERETLLQASPETDDIKDEVRSLLAAHDQADDFLESADALNRETQETQDPTYAPETLVGPYRILRLIGRGGMGVVYEAEDTRLHRRVALKALPPELSADERRRQRLRLEARAAAALQHPGIATVYSLEEIDGQVFISSEYLAGETLRHEIQRGALPPAAVVAAAIELTRALSAAHDRGIVHRDLKPENIIRTKDGALKILDFGLAQFERDARDLVSKSRLSVAGALAGTPPYMAPEQLLTRPTDFRADQFALGIVLYELATGAHPFAATSLPATIARILADTPDAPPPSSAVAGEVWNIIGRCLQKDPAHRFASTRDLLDALTHAATTRAFSAPRAPGAPAAPGAPSAPGALGTPGASSALGWWRFHQFAAALAYWSMVWPIWHIHRTLGRVGLFFFFVTLAAVVVAGSLRLHLWFSSRVYPEDLPAHRADVGRWIRSADIAFAALLIIGGIALPNDRAGWAALLISFGVGAAVAFLFIEPATARAAFREQRTKNST